MRKFTKKPKVEQIFDEPKKIDLDDEEILTPEKTTEPVETEVSTEHTRREIHAEFSETDTPRTRGDRRNKPGRREKRRAKQLAREEKKELKRAKRENKKHLKTYQKVIIAMVALVVVAGLGVSGFLLLNQNGDDGESPLAFLKPEKKEEKPTYFYDSLTGEVIAQSGTQYDKNGKVIKGSISGKPVKLSVEEAQAKADQINSGRTFCMQMPNGLDGARPQVGLNQAKIVFEAIAEAGITRFAVVWRNLDGSAIGPVRSLRNYYLDWDVPFDCTIVHAGGEDEAKQRVLSYPHLSESTTYMWRTGGHWSGNRFVGYYAPNNLFTDGALLNRYASDSGTTTSNPQTWPRLTPEEAAKERKQLKKATEDVTKPDQDENGKTIKKTTFPHQAVNNIDITYGYTGFNVHYTYDAENNRYLRSYTDYEDHKYYICPPTISQPKPEEQCGEAVQAAPNVVIAMTVQEQLSPVNHYREVIQTTGSGEAKIFQNGYVIVGTWEKSSVESQIVFKDQNGEVIKLAPGQTWISAVPAYRSTTYN